MKKHHNLHPADFFVLRAPRNNLSQLLKLGSARVSQTRQVLANWLEQGETQEALAIASPSLLSRIKYWQQTPDSSKGKKIEQALLKYFIRMSSRATPFGLFSGLGVGRVKAARHTQLEVGDKIQRKTRTDMHYLAALKDYLSKTFWDKGQLTFKKNDSLNLVHQHYRFIESYVTDGKMHYRLSEVESSEILTLLLDWLAPGTKLEQLTAFIRRQVPEASHKDAMCYLEQLVDSQVIIVDLPLYLTSDRADKALFESLSQLGLESHVPGFEQMLSELEKLDGDDCNQTSCYQSIGELLAQIPVTRENSKLIQVDYSLQTKDLVLDQASCEQILKDINSLQYLCHCPTNPLQELVAKVSTDYQGRMLPLKQLLDDELGFSMSSSGGFYSPLIAGLDLHNNSKNAGTFSLSPIQKLALDTLLESEQVDVEELQITPKKIQQQDEGDGRLPDSFILMLQLYKDQAGGQQVYFRGSSGPSAANMLGRFCHLDQGLKKEVSSLLAQEQQNFPDAILAEVVHLPEGRMGNVLARPRLRQYEIPFLADSCVARHNQIEIEDLYVYVQDDEIKLWSKRLKKQVIPRLSSAHNYESRSLNIYKFLCQLQNQQVKLPRFSWPDLLSNKPYLPRLKFGSLILAKRRWVLPRKALVELNGSTDYEAHAKALCAKYKLPTWVTYSAGDNVLLLNLSNKLMLESLLNETEGRERLALEESLDCHYDSQASLAGQALCHEVLLPVHNKIMRNTNPQTNKRLQCLKTAREHKRSFMPGSEWLSINIYTGKNSADNILLNPLQPLLQKLERQKVIHSSFFIRYGDPDWHIRLRLNGSPETLLSEVYPQICRLLMPMQQSRLIQGISLETYERESERYGGHAGILLAEQIFSINSNLSLQILSLAKQESEQYRTNLLLLGCDISLKAFGFDLSQRLALISDLRDAFAKEFKDTKVLRKSLGKKFSALDTHINDVFTAYDCNQGQHCWESHFRQYEQQLQPLAQAYLELENKQELTSALVEVIYALLHMFNNRVFHAYGREQEFVIYDLLRRYYQQQSHKAKRLA